MGVTSYVPSPSAPSRSRLPVSGSPACDRGHAHHPPPPTPQAQNTQPLPPTAYHFPVANRKFPTATPKLCAPFYCSFVRFGGTVALSFVHFWLPHSKAPSAGVRFQQGSCGHLSLPCFANIPHAPPFHVGPIQPTLLPQSILSDRY